VIVYLYLFNVRTRQSLHDLEAEAYVVDANTEGFIVTKGFWKWHCAVLGGGLFAGAALTSIMIGGLGKNSLFGELMSVQRAVLDSGKVQAARVQIGKNRTHGQTMWIAVNWNGQPGNYDLASTQIAAIVLRADPEANKLDYIGVGFTEGFKIGFVNFSQNRVVMRRPADWATKIQQPRFDLIILGLLTPGKSNNPDSRANPRCKSIGRVGRKTGWYWFLKGALHLCYRHHGGITKDDRRQQGDATLMRRCAANF
jgi:hypothetical protein